MPRCWRPLCSPPAQPAAAEAALNRARLTARRWCSISPPTRSTRASTRAQQQGFYRDAGVDLTIREPGESTDAPKLLEAGRADFAILDIHDLGIAREHGLDIVGAMPIVQRPLAAVIARGDGPVRRPRDLEGHTVGVTGLPSDEAVVDSEVSADGGDPAQVHRVTIGFNAVASLAAGKVDAATGFWNAEGVALRGEGVPIRDLQGRRIRRAALSRAGPDRLAQDDRGPAGPGRRGGRAPRPAATRFAVANPAAALDDLVAANPALDRAEQAAQLRALGPDLRPAPFDPRVLREWAAWDLEHGLLSRPLDVERAFRTGGGPTPRL